MLVPALRVCGALANPAFHTNILAIRARLCSLEAEDKSQTVLVQVFNPSD